MFWFSANSILSAKASAQTLYRVSTWENDIYRLAISGSFGHHQNTAGYIFKHLMAKNSKLKLELIKRCMKLFIMDAALN